MRISDLYINGFGIFAEQELSGLSSGVNVFLGNNEAGKSTCLAFLRYMLFGLPRKVKNISHHEPLRGGNHAGALGLDTDKFGAIRLERSFKPKRIALSSADGTNMDESALQALLGNVSRELYTNVYGFSLTELQSKEALDADAVKNALYGTVQGGGASYTEVVKHLAAKREGLFKKGGKVLPLNQRLKELEQIRKDLNSSEDSVDAYLAISKELLELEESLLATTEQLGALRADIGTVTADKRLWNTYREYMEAQAALEALKPLVSFPQDGLTRFETSTERINDLHNQLASEHRKLEATQEQIAQQQPLINTTLLSQQDAVRALSDEKAIYTAKKDDLEKMGINLAAVDREIQTLLEQLGGSWSTDHVVAFDLSDTTRLQVASFEEAYDSATIELSRAQDEEKRGQKLLAEAEHVVAQQQRELSLLPSFDTEFDSDLLHTLEQQRSGVEAMRSRAAVLHQQIEDKNNAVKEQFADLGEQWNEQTIATVDISMTARSKLGIAYNQLQQAERFERESQQNHDSAVRSFSSLQEQKRRLEEQLDAIPVDIEQLQHNKEILRTVRTQFSTLLGAQASTGNSSLAVPSALGLAGVATMALPFVMDTPRSVMFLGGIFLAAACALLIVNRKKSMNAKQIEGEIIRSMEKSPELFPQSMISEEAIQQAEDRLEVMQQAAVEQKALQERLTEVTNEESTLFHEATSSKNKLVAASEAAAEKQAVWKQITAPFKLPEHADNTLCSEILSRITELRRLMQERDILVQHHAVQQDKIEEYYAQAQALESLANVRELSTLLAKLDELFLKSKEAAKNKDKVLAAKERLRLAEKQHGAAKEQAVAVTKLVATATEAMNSVTAQISAWLQERMLPVTLRVHDISDTLRIIKDAKKLLNDRESIEAHLEAYQKSRISFEAQQDRLLELASITPDCNLDQTIRREETQDKILRLLNQSQKAEATVGNLAANLKERQDAAKVHKEGLLRLQKEVDSLFTAAEVSNKEDFLARHATYTEQQGVLDKVKQLTATLKAAAEDSDIEKLAERIGQRTEEELAAQEAELRTEIATAEKYQQELLHQRSDLKAKKQVLTSQEDQTAVRIKSEELREEANLLAKEWARYRIAEHLLARARERFEQEQQPEVVKHAGRFFATITENAYKGVYKPLGEETVYALSADGTQRRPEDLSRGTAEQLYLSLRLGHILSHSAHNESLPVIMDDIMVNFDPFRAANTAKTITELSTHNQVFLFTCHPQTVELMQRQDTDLSVFSVQDGELRKL